MPELIDQVDLVVTHPTRRRGGSSSFVFNYQLTGSQASDTDENRRTPPPQPPERPAPSVQTNRQNSRHADVTIRTSLRGATRHKAHLKEGGASPAPVDEPGLPGPENAYVVRWRNMLGDVIEYHVAGTAGETTLVVLLDVVEVGLWALSLNNANKTVARAVFTDSGESLFLTEFHAPSSPSA